MRLILALAATLAVAAGSALAAPAPAPDDGFAAFWQTFAAALRTDNQAALAPLVQLGPGLSDYDNTTPLTFAQFHARFLTRTERACLARQHPVRGVDDHGTVAYSAFCGNFDYGFSKTAAGWQLTDLGPND